MNVWWKVEKSLLRAKETFTKWWRIKDNAKGIVGNEHVQLPHTDHSSTSKY